MQETNVFETLPIRCSLSVVTVEDAIFKYLTKYKCAPTTLIVGLDYVMTAYRVVREVKQLLVVVPVPGFPSEAWMICGSNGCFYTEGI